MRVADDLDGVGSKPPRDLGVERGRQGVAGDQERLEILLRRHRGADGGRVEGVGRDRRHALAGGRRGRFIEAAATQLLVGREAPGELVLSALQRQAVGDPFGWPTDRLDDVAPDARVDLRCCVADRTAGKQD
jgi:hypothetical protein